jgi:hypothetical protein
MIYSEYFGFTPSVSFDHSYILTSIHRLVLPEGKPAKPGKLPKCNALSSILVNLIEKYVLFFRS